MTRRHAPAVMLALAAAALLVSRPADSLGEFPHISLVRSVPAADTVLVEPPSEIRLWFSGVPREEATSIRIFDSSGEGAPVHVMDPAAHPEDPTVQFAPIHGSLAPGAYFVAWTTVARDGAPARGRIPFTVRAP